jgi:hypothetical protein
VRMHQVKIFSGSEDERDVLEREINEWLVRTRAKPVQIFGNIAPQTFLGGEKQTPIRGEPKPARKRFGSSDIVIVVLYEVRKITSSSRGPT